MKPHALLAAMALGIGCLVPAFSAEGVKPQGKAVKKPQEPPEQKEQVQPVVVKKSSPRLPNNYGKLGLTAEQKNEIYAIQARHNGQIDALEEQIRQLKEHRDAEIVAVLSDKQREKLMGLVDGKKKKGLAEADKELMEKPQPEE